ncbi:transmembrane protein 121B [Anabrus simplex]|uniref:transmembrane protein 121B n=1 Tax=Anabrus simplex TaxID=316456 RepID=UPI0034DCD058
MPANCRCCAPMKKILQILNAAFLIFVLIVQGTILNIYIISHYNDSVTPYFWFLADFACLFVFAGTLTVSYQYLTKVYRNSAPPVKFNLSPRRIHSKFPTSKLGILPLSYSSWIIYSAIQLSKVVIIFKSSIPFKLTPADTFGPQLLQVAIAMSGIIFCLLVEGHNWAPHHSPRYNFVTSVCAKTALEVLDTVDFLAILFIKDSHKAVTLEEAIRYLDDTILILCSFNFFLPALALYKLSLSDVTTETLFWPVTLIYNLFHLCAIDIPFLVIRLYLWVGHGYNSSIFLMKNIFGIIFILRSAYPDIVEVRKSYGISTVPDNSDTNGGVNMETGDNIEMEMVLESPHKPERKKADSAGDTVA